MRFGVCLQGLSGQPLPGGGEEVVSSAAGSCFGDVKFRGLCFGDDRMLFCKCFYVLAVENVLKNNRCLHRVTGFQE